MDRLRSVAALTVFREVALPTVLLVNQGREPALVILTVMLRLCVTRYTKRYEQRHNIFGAA